MYLYVIPDLFVPLERRLDTFLNKMLFPILTTKKIIK